MRRRRVLSGVTLVGALVALAACGPSRTEATSSRLPFETEEPPGAVVSPHAAPPGPPALLYCESATQPHVPAVVVMPQQRFESEELVRAAWQAVRAGQPRDAAQLAREAIAKDPRSFRARMALGVALGRLERHSDALDAFCGARRLDESSRKALYWIGYCYVELRRYEDGERVMRALLDIDPDWADAWYELGFVLSRQERYVEAIEAFDGALKRRPGDARAQFERGSALRKIGRLEEAEAALGAAAKGRSSYLPYLHEHADILLELGRHRDAEKVARRAVREDGGTPESRLLLGRALLGRGKCRKARKQLTKAQQLAPPAVRLEYDAWVERAQECGRR